jgi:uncharacterized membrane protein YkvA (DUF1232 family)
MSVVVLKQNRMKTLTWLRLAHQVVKSGTFKDFEKEAGKVVSQKERLANLLKKTAEKGKEVKDVSVLKQIGTFRRMIKAYRAGEYKKIPLKSITLIVTGLIYFISPLDMIPDFILVGGWIDDFALLTWVFKAIGSDIEHFTNWEKSQAVQVEIIENAEV